MTRRSRADANPGRGSATVPVLALLLGGCVSPVVHARPARFAEVADVFKAHGVADVAVEEGGTTPVRADRVVDIWMPGDAHVLERQRCLTLPLVHWDVCRGHDQVDHDADQARSLTIRELVNRCEDGEQRGACLALAVRDEPVALGTRTRLSAPALASVIGGGIALGAGAYCLDRCDSKGVAVGALGAAFLLLLAPLAALR